MRLPFALINDKVETTLPSKSGNALNAGIDFYIPTKGVKIEFNPGLPDNELIFMKTKPILKLGKPVKWYTKKDVFEEISCVTIPVVSESCDNSETYVAPRINKSEGGFWLYPGENVLIHSGIAIETDFGQFEFVCNRSGVASKKSLVVGAHVIDTGYANELMFDVHNIGLEPQLIRPGEKIVQVVVVPTISCTPIQVPYEQLYSGMETEFRGLKGFGSSDKK